MKNLLALPLLALLRLSLAAPVNPSSPAVSLPYAEYQGFYNATSGLNVFLGVRYAASTEGENRWRVAQPPLNVKAQGVINATSQPKQCPQAIAGGVVNSTAYSPTQAIDSEDCLFLNVFSPPGARNLPVLVWIFGGSWDHSSVRTFDPTPMIQQSNNSFVSVIINYRLGIFGFMAPPASQNASANVGITDARKALEWVQSYIHHFGGESSKVTIWGQSAGGGTVLHLLAGEAEHPRESPLFRSAVVSSPYLVPMGQCDSSYWQTQFHNFSSAANCTDSVACLRNASTDVLRTLNHQFDPILQTGHPSAYEPCIEGPGGYLVKNTATQLANGNLAGHHVLGGNNYNDGSAFVPTSITPPSNSTNVTALATTLLSNYLSTSFPLNSTQISTILSLYPLSSFVDNHARGAEIFQDLVFACPVTWTMEAFPQSGYRYLYAVGTSIHATDNAYEFPYWYNTLEPYSPSEYQSYIGSVTSFIRSTSPNTFQPPLVSYEPTWPVFGGGYNGSYKVLNISSPQNVSTAYIGSGAVQVGTQARCEFWKQARVEGGW